MVNRNFLSECSRGISCPYRHAHVNQVELTQPMRPDNDYAIGYYKATNKVCHNYMRGECHYGNRCRFVHSRPAYANYTRNFRNSRLQSTAWYDLFSYIGQTCCIHLFCCSPFHFSLVLINRQRLLRTAQRPAMVQMKSMTRMTLQNAQRRQGKIFLLGGINEHPLVFFSHCKYFNIFVPMLVLTIKKRKHLTWQ